MNSWHMKRLIKKLINLLFLYDLKFSEPETLTIKEKCFIVYGCLINRVKFYPIQHSELDMKSKISDKLSFLYKKKIPFIKMLFLKWI